MAFSWWQRWWEGEFLPCWQHFQKVSKRAKQCNRIHNMNSNNTTRIIWHNNWASKLKHSGSTRAEEPWRALRALLACRAYSEGPCRQQSCGSVVAGSLQRLQAGCPRIGKQPRAAAGRHQNSDQATLPHQACRSFLLSSGSSLYDFKMLDIKISA